MTQSGRRTVAGKAVEMIHAVRRIPDTRIPDCRSPRNHHARADTDAAIEVHNVCVVHAYAAVRHESANRARRVGAVDRIFTAGQRHGRRSHRVMRGAAWNDARQRRVVAPDRCWRRPRRLDVLAIDDGRAGPLHASATNAYWVADRFACTDKVIKTAFAGADDDRSRRMAVLHRHDVATGLRRPKGKSECRNGGCDSRRKHDLSPHRHIPLLLTAPTDPPSQRDSTQAHANRSGLFLSNETAVWLSALAQKANQPNSGAGTPGLAGPKV